MPNDVRERFLHDPEPREFDRGGEQPHRTLDLFPHRKAGRVRPDHEVVEASQGRRRVLRTVLFVDPPQHAEHRSELRERLLARVLDRGECGPSLLRPFLEQVEGDPGLHVDHRDVVGQHIVQLARDRQALLARVPALFFLLHPGRRRDALSADADDLCSPGDDEQPRYEPENLPDRGCRLVAHDRREHDGGHKANREDDPRSYASAQEDGRKERDQR